MIGLTSRRSQPPLALSVPLSRFTPRVGGGSAFFVRRHPSMGEYIAYSTVLVILVFYFFMRFRWLSRRLDKELAEDIDKPKFTFTDILVLAFVTFAFCFGHRIAFD